MKPFSVPKVETTAPTATRTPPAAPHITRATSASGAAEVASSPDNKELLAYLGLARIHAGDSGGALEPLKKAIGLDDNYAEAHFGLGLAYVKMKDLGKAVPELEKAVNLAPNHAYAHYNLGMAYNQTDKKALSIAHLRRFVELAPDAPEAPAVRSFLSKV